MSEFGDFDATVVEPSTGGGGGVIPAGQYKAMITKSQWKKTKAGTGEYLELVFEVATGEQQGKRVYARLNLKNPSDVAVKIAQAELSAICHATGIMKPNQSAQLHDIPLVIKVSIKEREDKPGAYSNEIIGYESTEKAVAKKTAQRETSPPVDDDDAPF